MDSEDVSGAPAPQQLTAGVAYDDAMHAAYESAGAAAADGHGAPPPDPFGDADAFLRWLAEPEHDGPVPVSRYVAAIRRGRKDLLDAFPAVPGRDAGRLVEWVLDHGVHEMSIAPALLPHRPPEPGPPPYVQPGVNLAGFLTAELGVGEVARRLADAMDAASVPFGTYTFDRTTSRRALDATDRGELRYDTNLVCVNADSLGSFVQTTGPAFSLGRRRIGVWFWETADLPSMFHTAFGDVDELWAASDFVADALRASAPPGLPVVRFPLPIVAPPTDPAFTRAAAELPDDRFVFLFSFDYLSVAERKNPFAVVEAFRRAFAPDEGPLLVIKSINGAQRPDDAARLATTADGRDDIVLRDGYLDAPANAALLRLADCFVSLHRSEGFGFNLADAMALGTPVIATRYSGNLTFMRDDDCLLVDCTEVEVGPGHFPYLPESLWAEPDIEQAAAAMRHVVEAPGAAATLAHAAQARVLRDFSPLATGTFIRNRLAGLRATPPRAAAAPRRPHPLVRLARRR
jgi:glycosyltransferase involved in cell wall biosynthesis